MKDPTYDEMKDFLQGTGYPLEATGAIEEGIYWFAVHYHGGQFTNLYEAINLCGFVPGPIAVMSSEDVASLVYEMLELEYCQLSDDTMDKLLTGAPAPEDKDLYDKEP